MITVGQLILKLKKYPEDTPVWLMLHPSASICEVSTISDALEYIRAHKDNRMIILEGDDDQ